MVPSHPLDRPGLEADSLTGSQLRDQDLGICRPQTVFLLDVGEILGLVPHGQEAHVFCVDVAVVVQLLRCAFTGWAEPILVLAFDVQAEDRRVDVLGYFLRLGLGWVLAQQPLGWTRAVLQGIEEVGGTGEGNETEPVGEDLV